MVHVHLSLDAYGKVKTVEKTPIVTWFFAVSAFPVAPLGSYYLARMGTTTSTFGAEDREIQGIPLARLSMFSVLMAYFRGLCAVLVLAGCTVIIPLIAVFSGEQLDPLGLMIMQGQFISLGAGVCLGVLSYLPFPISRRERSIRLLCGELLGISADPALIRLDPAVKIAREMQAQITRAEAARPLPASDDELRLNLLCELVLVRATIASQGIDGNGREVLERETDELLERLEHP